jgi:cell division protein FtsL
MITNQKKIVRYIIVIVFIIFAWGIFAHFQYNYITTNKKINAQEEFLKAETSIHSAINQTTIFI